jgi:hypothetical protein
VTVADTAAPRLTLPGDLTAEATGAGAAVDYETSATDVVDGTVPVTCTPASGSTFDVGTTTVNCSATDEAGNEATGSFTVTVADTTAPQLTVPSATTAEATGANGAAVTYAASATDSVDGLVAVTCSPASGSTFPVGTTTVNCSATDEAGNEATGSFTVAVADTTAPEITFVGGPSSGGSYSFGSVPAAPTCTASDVVSGTVPCTVSGYSSAVGKATLTATATDGAGNEASKTGVSYTVLPWTLKGFYQPVDMSGVWNTVKGGSTVPLKFEAFAGGELTDISAVKSFTQRQVACPGGALVTDAIEQTVSGGTNLRYDATGGQFIQNWATPKKPGSCYAVTMTTQDGSVTSANFALK